MVRWWNIRSATPNGMTINRAWHLRQFLYALLPSAVALISLESAKCWGDLERHKKALGASAQQETDSSSQQAKTQSSNGSANVFFQAFRHGTKLFDKAKSITLSLMEEMQHKHKSDLKADEVRQEKTTK